MLEVISIVLLAMFLSGSVGMWWRGRVRRLGVARVDGLPITRHAEAVSLTANYAGRPPLASLRAGRAHRLTADLVLAGERMVVATDRGVLLDVGGGRGQKLESIRCTGPMRLVMEGRMPRASTNEPAPFRLEWAIEDAEGWAEALAPFSLAAPGRGPSRPGSLPS